MNWEICKYKNDDNIYIPGNLCNVCKNSSSFFHFESKEIFATFQVVDKSRVILHRMTKEEGKSVERIFV